MFLLILRSCGWLRFVCIFLFWGCMMILWLVSSDLSWLFLVWNGYLIKNSKNNSNRVARKQNPRTCPYDELYGLPYSNQKFMKLFLGETRHLVLSNNKPIGFEMKKLWIFEVNLRILSTVLTSMCCEGHNLPYINLN